MGKHKMQPKYDEDIYGWSIHTAQLLREKKMDEVDFDNVIEEIEALGRSEKNELISHLTLVISHLLKWEYQPDRRGNSWVYTIDEQRKQSKFTIRDNPSLKSKLDEILMRSHEIALLKAAKETGINKNMFPKECPYTFEQIIDDGFYPE
jgi:hypothetical protein